MPNVSVPTVLPDGYENAPDNVKNAFTAGVRHGYKSGRADTGKMAREKFLAGGTAVWLAVMAGLDPHTGSVPRTHLDKIRGDLPIRRVGT